jgi:hypothetical protein
MKVMHFGNHRLTAAGLWITAFGIFVQAISGAKGYPKFPPGILFLAGVGALVYFTAGWRWASIPALLLAALISVGVFTTHGTAERLAAPADIGPFVGTVIQLIGLVSTLLAGIAGTIKSYRWARP